MSVLLDALPLYAKGVLSLFTIFLLPGLLIVRFVAIRDFPLRWFTVVVGSLIVNHALVTFTAQLHLDPPTVYLSFIAGVVAALCVLEVFDAPGWRSRSEMRVTDIGWVVAGLMFLAVVYINIWKHGFPSTFDDGDASVSWNRWALVWSQGQFPIDSIGYPQFVPTIWAVTYILLDSKVQYFAFYCYVILIAVPLCLNAAQLGRLGWGPPILQGLVFAWFIAEIRDPLLRISLVEGWPDWIATVFAYTAATLFLWFAPGRKSDNSQFGPLLLSLCLACIAAATKPVYGLFVLAILASIIVDAVRFGDGRAGQTRIVLVALGVVALFGTLYWINFSHLSARGMPNYPVSDLSARLARAWTLFNSNFTLPFRILCVAGLAVVPFLRRTRWLALPIYVGLWIWADKASYDLRNCLGILVIAVMLPLQAVLRARSSQRSAGCGPDRAVADRLVAAFGVLALLALSVPLAVPDAQMRERFASEQIERGAGIEINQRLEKLLRSGCTLFSSSAYLYTIAAWEKYRDQIRFFHYPEPVTDRLRRELYDIPGCKAVFFPAQSTHPSITSLFQTYFQDHGFKKVAEGRWMELWVSGDRANEQLGSRSDLSRIGQ